MQSGRLGLRSDIPFCAWELEHGGFMEISSKLNYLLTSGYILILYIRIVSGSFSPCSCALAEVVVVSAIDN